MAKTAAERSKAYRDAKRDAVTNQGVTVERDEFALTQDGLDDMGEPEQVTVDRDGGQAGFARSRAAFGKLVDMNAGLKLATRANPELLNHGQWMNADQLKASPYKHNRVPIPGDYDYEGVAVC